MDTGKLIISLISIGDHLTASTNWLVSSRYCGVAILQHDGKQFASLYTL
ncbi:MAG: hypothetical protein HY648_10485 [Acidobacteria bacterium]|nr:hypothetical protein [Acidobacteriota bacterium]